jgi:Tfp pilus assembly protein FimV
MSLLLLFNQPAAAPAPTVPTGGAFYPTPEELARLRRRARDQEKAEDDHRAKVKAKAREIEKTIAEAYAKATGKPRLKEALRDVEAPAEFTPETIAELGQEIVGKLSTALEDTGRRYAPMRRQMEELARELLDFERLLYQQDRLQAEDDEIAAMLLLAAV